MILDKENLFDGPAAAITVTRNSINVIDLQTTLRNIGVGENLFVWVLVTETFTAAGAATLQIALVTDDNSDLSSPIILQDQVAVIPVADLVAGFKREFRIHPGDMEKYLGLVYTVASGPMTAGKITAGILFDIESNRIYAKNFQTA